MMEGPALQSPASTPLLKIGTRGSPLALAQAEEVRRRLAAAHGMAETDIAIETISTAGDRSQPANRPLRDLGGKGMFSKEIEDRLRAGDIDIAVHSAKDMAAILPDGLDMPVFLPREDVRDAFICLKAASLEDLPEGAVVGTSSIRRRAQLLHRRPDLRIVEFRGNVGTRLQKLADGVADATLLAAAGLLRTGQAGRITGFLDLAAFPPAPAQGAIGIELRRGDDKTRALIAPLNDPATHAAITAERAFLAEIDGSCRTPVAALTRHDGPQIAVFGQILSLDGSEIFENRISGPAADAEALGRSLGRSLRQQAGAAFFDALRAGF